VDTGRIFKLGCRTINLTLRQGYGIEGLPHKRAQVHRRRLAGRERGGGRLLRVRWAASERSLGGGRAGGGEQSIIEGEALRHFVGSRGRVGLHQPDGPGSAAGAWTQRELRLRDPDFTMDRLRAPR
jgi:hypothetical protein